MKRFFRNTWRRLTIARVRWPKDIDDWIGALLFLLFQMQVFAFASGLSPLADFIGAFPTFIYCAVMWLASLWHVPIDENHYYEAVAALYGAPSRRLNDSDDLG